MSDPETPNHIPAPRSNAQQHHLTQVSACHKRSKIGVIMKRKLGIHSMHPYHDSTLIKVMMANGQQLQPMHALFSSIPLGELNWRSLTLSSLGKKWRWTAAHVHITFSSEHNHHTSQIIYGQCMTIEKESNQDTSEYWDGSSSSSTASSKRMPLFFPMLQSLSCRGCMQCRGVKETLQFWFIPLHLCTEQTGRDYHLYGHWTWRGFRLLLLLFFVINDECY